ncbi:ATP-binding protein [Peribacillus cavernae]|uniref:ATP-binding protein n=1 Tax=Peribacillus cavernae TaxID=1674310 RepID=A0A433HTA9_9BACI|nr:ATP-binding protein [Peribacillus cavernae]MDQ0218585.1 hypothetical protein [Peribacillus cavernae]RUQ31573.1 ATP-binding protein [Peribacillus cavernae]
MRDPLIIPYNHQFLVIASDNSGGIGLKEKDVVKVPYDIVAYYSFRVAVMECIAAGADPVSIVMQNFCGEEAWSALNGGIQQGVEELGIDIPVTGSTESNMELLQSAVGMNVIGISNHLPNYEMINLSEDKLAVIGKPLVGNEVMEYPQSIVPLAVFKWLCEQDEITVLPVGSKGIAHEVRQLLPEIKLEDIQADLDIHKSAGPSTCLVISYPVDLKTAIQRVTGNLFYGVTLSSQHDRCDKMGL